MKKFLIVEDDKSMRSLYSVLIGRYFKDSTVNFSYNGSDALEKVTDSGFDLIISDINMEIMDGITFHSKLKEMDPSLADRVVFMSSTTNGPHVRYIREEGLSFLPKPFKVSDFYALLASNYYLGDNSPEIKEGLGARKYKRLNYNNNCIIETSFTDSPAGDRKIKAQAIDYSFGGMGLKYSGEMIPSGEYVQVFMEGVKMSNKEARVVWTSGSMESEYHSGLQWI